MKKRIEMFVSPIDDIHLECCLCGKDYYCEEFWTQLLNANGEFEGNVCHACIRNRVPLLFDIEMPPTALIREAFELSHRKNELMISGAPIDKIIQQHEELKRLIDDYYSIPIRFQERGQ